MISLVKVGIFLIRDIFNKFIIFFFGRSIGFKSPYILLFYWSFFTWVVDFFMSSFLRNSNLFGLFRLIWGIVGGRRRRYLLRFCFIFNLTFFLLFGLFLSLLKHQLTSSCKKACQTNRPNCRNHTLRSRFRRSTTFSHLPLTWMQRRLQVSRLRVFFL